MTLRPKPHLLAVDDENDVLLILKTSLREDYEVETASSGQEALQKAPEFAPDIIILDLMMPDMDGITLLEKLRKEESLADTPVIFLTGVSDKTKLREALDHGTQFYIRKPFKPDELSAKVSQDLHASGIGPPEEA